MRKTLLCAYNVKMGYKNNQEQKKTNTLLQLSLGVLSENDKVDVPDLVVRLLVISLINLFFSNPL